MTSISERGTVLGNFEPHGDAGSLLPLAVPPLHVLEMNEIERALAIGIPGFLGCSALLLGFISWQTRREGREKEFRPLAVLGVTLLGCVWMISFVTAGVYFMETGSPIAGKTLNLIGIFGSIAFVIAIARPKNAKREQIDDGNAEKPPGVERKP